MQGGSGPNLTNNAKTKFPAFRCGKPHPTHLIKLSVGQGPTDVTASWGLVAGDSPHSLTRMHSVCHRSANKPVGTDSDSLPHTQQSARSGITVSVDCIEDFGEKRSDYQWRANLDAEQATLWHVNCR